jgi:hypothetical protein
MLIGAHISQVASSTPFLCCSRFSPIAFNLSNTKSSIQLLYVLHCPFRHSNPFDRIPRDRPYIHLRLSLTTNWNGKLKKSSIHGSAAVVSFTKFAGRTILHPMILGNPLTTSTIPQISSTNSTPATHTNLVLLHVLARVLVLVPALVLQPNLNRNTSARRSSLPGREVLSGFHAMMRSASWCALARSAMVIGAH